MKPHSNRKNQFSGQGMLIIKEFGSKNLMNDREIPFASAVLCTDSKELGGHLPCMAYDRLALEVWAFQQASMDVCQSGELEVTVHGRVMADVDNGVFFIHIEQITFWVPFAARELAKQLINRSFGIDSYAGEGGS